MWTLATLLAVVVVFLLAALGVQSVGPSEYRRRLAQSLNLWPIDQTVAFTGNTHTTTTVDGLSSIAGLAPGMTISGAGITAGTTIVTVTNVGGGSITLSAAATATASAVPLTAFWATSSAQVHLFSAPFTGGIDPAPADFTEANFTGYVAQTVSSFFGPYSQPDGSAEVDFGDFGWVLTSTPTVGNVIYGYWVDYPFPAGGATRVVATWEVFPTTITMQFAGNAVVINVPMKAPTPGTVSVIG